MQINEYWNAVIASTQSHPEWRFGQAAFNVLCVNRPDISEQVRATDIDPFYIEDVGKNLFVWRQFVDFVQENW